MWFHNTPHPYRPRLMRPRDFDTWGWWNIWRTAQPPFGRLTTGDPVVLVDTWGTRRQSRMSWLARIETVVQERFTTADEGLALIESAVGVGPDQVRATGYALDRLRGSGVVIGWRAAPLRRLDVPRPDDLVFRPTGWQQEDDPATLEAWGLGPALLARPAPRHRRIRSLARAGYGHCPPRRTGASLADHA